MEGTSTLFAISTISLFAMLLIVMLIRLYHSYSSYHVIQLSHNQITEENEPPAI